MTHAPSHHSYALYDATVPVFDQYLARLDAMLNMAQQHYVLAAPDWEHALLDSCLSPGMLPLSVQSEVACNMALRGAWPIAGFQIPDYGQFERSMTGLHARIAYVRNLLAQLERQSFASANQRSITFEAGQAMHTLPADVFIHTFAVPNFFFHLNMAYALLRHAGVPLGKADFDGLHVYL